MKAPENDRRDWGIVIAILLLGFLCIILAAGWAVRFSPRWRLDASMESMLDPNSDFLTSRPSGFVEPIDPSILTLPVWLNVFLTPGADYATRVPPPTSTPTPIITPVIFATATRTDIPPTSTLVYFPSPTPTKPPISNPSNTPGPGTFTSTPSRTPPVPPTFTWTPSNTPVTPTITWTPSNIPPPSADLSITKTDNSTSYVGGAWKDYVITVYNAGPSDVVGATVTDMFSPNFDPSFVDWGCAPSGGASCTSVGQGNITDTVNLPSGSSVTYNVRAQVVSNPSGPLVNTASVSYAADPNTGNNSATDSDTLIVVDPFPPGGEIGPTPDDNVYHFPEPPGSVPAALTLNITTEVNGDVGIPDLIYYEYLNNGYVYLDQVIIQISDGNNWYTVFYWGDEIRDTNTNMDYNLLPCPGTPPYPPIGCEPQSGSLYEPDERQIPPINFYPYSTDSRGVAIDLDIPGIPQGTYPYLRIIAPAGDTDGQLEIDGIAAITP